MSFNSQVITVFISSPSDVSADRQIVLDEMQAWNQRNARTKGCMLSALTWEDLVSPDIGDSGQDIVNLEIGDDYDVFLGLMWGRFGTPTNKAESGTEEEFQRALGRRKSGEALRISFFFRNSDIPFDEIDAEQIAKVRAFRNRISEGGAFYGQYADERELASALTRLFDRISNEKTRYLTGATSLSPAQDSGGNSTLGLTEETSDPKEDDFGLLDLEERLNCEAEKMSIALQSWGEQFRDVNAVVQSATMRISEISQFAQPDRQELRAQIDLVTERLQSFGEFANDKIGGIEDNLEGIYQALSSLSEIVDEFEITDDRRDGMRKDVLELSSTVKEADTVLSQYIKTMEELPRVEKKFNRARDAVVMIHKRLRKKMRDFANRMEQIEF